MPKIPTHHDWEPLLLGADYSFAAFAGLNRYYVRSEDRDLAEPLQVPVNLLDDFLPYEHGLQVQVFTQELEKLAGTVAALQALNEDLKQVEPLLWQDLEYFKRRFEELEAGYSSLAASVSASPAVPEEVGPMAIAVATRLSRLAKRYPKSANVARRGLLVANGIRKRVARS